MVHRACSPSLRRAALNFGELRRGSHGVERGEHTAANHSGQVRRIDALPEAAVTQNFDAPKVWIPPERRFDDDGSTRNAGYTSTDLLVMCALFPAEEDISMVNLAIDAQHVHRTKAALSTSTLRQHSYASRRQCIEHR